MCKQSFTKSTFFLSHQDHFANPSPINTRAMRNNRVSEYSAHARCSSPEPPLSNNSKNSNSLVQSPTIARVCDQECKFLLVPLPETGERNRGSGILGLGGNAYAGQSAKRRSCGRDQRANYRFDWRRGAERWYNAASYPLERSTVGAKQSGGDLSVSCACTRGILIGRPGFWIQFSTNNGAGLRWLDSLP